MLIFSFMQHFLFDFFNDFGCLAVCLYLQFWADRIFIIMKDIFYFVSFQQVMILEHICSMFATVLADKHWVVHQLALQAFSTFAEVCYQVQP